MVVPRAAASTIRRWTSSTIPGEPPPRHGGGELLHLLAEMIQRRPHAVEPGDIALERGHVALGVAQPGASAFNLAAGIGQFLAGGPELLQCIPDRFSGRGERLEIAHRTVQDRAGLLDPAGPLGEAGDVLLQAVQIVDSGPNPVREFGDPRELAAQIGTPGWRGSRPGRPRW